MMAKEYYKILAPMKDTGPQTIDRNEALIQFKEKFSKQFQELSEVGKVVATIKFLQGVTVFRDKIEKVKSKTPHYLPSSSKDIGEYQLLHPTIMEKFFEYYNNITQKPENRDLREAKRQCKYTPIMSILERLDC